ncbi:Tim44/TimA family putative adaptor protein [Caenispirillum bisanense]|uniref:Predicted lipid-binding transport protein, Tim44 family n=1 Tax=Caenispirillum bisanense TaxID=414052 RepID=A0A286G9U9_9PROT|nr:Tim44/TimA family putative adaptor protein [Caenispirillum bisanense]SOD92301.1 Predicted lipid-binding transport protein, Tim44 family [Caenispirillum bisanense]
MSEGFQFVDIIFLALVAGFLILRLRSVLGRRTGDEELRRQQAEQRLAAGRRAAPATDDRGNVIELPGRRPAAPAEEDLDLGAYAGTPVEAGIRDINAADRSFEPNGFLRGARGAFEMIVEAFARGDKDALRPLLADEVFANFSAAIDQRKQAGETMETRILGIKKLEIRDAAMRGRDAVVTVLFQSEQINLVIDQSGVVVDGDEKTPVDVTDVWTFARDTGDPDPNWQLVATTAPE